MGKKVAEKLHGNFLYLERPDLRKLYPEDHFETDAIEHYLNDHQPDIVFARDDQHAMQLILGRKDGIMHISDSNENVSKQYGKIKGLVCHHLTPELLASEGIKFRGEYPNLTSPLIAIMIVNPSDYHTRTSFIDHLISHIKLLPAATLFVCACRRTEKMYYDSFLTALEQALDATNLKQNIHLQGFHFQDTANTLFNPYIGLLNEAEHVIVYGESQSLVSEPLAAGKPCIVYDNYTKYDQLKCKGLVLEFNKAADKTIFEQRKIIPVDVTDIVAQGIADEFNYKAKSFWKKAIYNIKNLFRHQKIAPQTPFL